MGRRKNIDTPEILWQLFCDYVKHEKEHPWFKVEYVGKDGERVATPLQVPITFEGFECYVADQDIIQDLSHYSANTDGAYDEFRTIITRIRNNCFSQNYKGAAVGLFNANLVAKKLGLVDKKDIKASVTSYDVDFS